MELNNELVKLANHVQREKRKLDTDKETLERKNIKVYLQEWHGNGAWLVDILKRTTARGHYKCAVFCDTPNSFTLKLFSEELGAFVKINYPDLNYYHKTCESRDMCDNLYTYTEHYLEWSDGED